MMIGHQDLMPSLSSSLLLDKKTSSLPRYSNKGQTLTKELNQELNARLVSDFTYLLKYYIFIIILRLREILMKQITVVIKVLMV